jgi:hypothetical protein
MAGILTELLGSIPQLIQKFIEVLQMSAPQAVLIIVGGIFLAFSIIVLGYLTLGAILRPIGGLPTPGRGQQNQ